MKDYAKRKKNKKWSLAKNKVVDSPAVTQVKDDKNVVVRPARAEQSHEVVQLSKKSFDPETGTAIADQIQDVTVAQCDIQIASLNSRIADLTADKDGWIALKVDIAAL
jgi:hypothetical protein|tara:strand:- start:983 stop:1306 length:324 start_codon:yes stop_codon:yes gene_type:complete